MNKLNRKSFKNSNNKIEINVINGELEIQLNFLLNQKILNQEKLISYEKDNKNMNIYLLD